MEAERLRWARDRSARVARARASTTGGFEATVAAGVAEAALAAAAATAAAAGDLGTCGETAGQAASCVRAGAGGQRVMHNEDGGGKDGDSGACEEIRRAARGGGVGGGGVTEAGIVFVGENAVEGGRPGVQAGAAAAAARPAEAAIVVGRGLAVS